MAPTVAGLQASYVDFDSFYYRSPRLATSHYCQQLTLSVPLFVCHAPSNRFFFFVYWCNRAIFLAVSFPRGTLQNVVLWLWICCHGNEIWSIFSKISHCFFFCFSMELSHFWVVSSPWPLYKTLFFDFWFRRLNAQNLLIKICTKSPIIWQIDRRCLRLLGSFRGWWDVLQQWWVDGSYGTMQNVVGPILVGMTTEFGLGVEIQSPTGLCLCLSGMLANVALHVIRTLSSISACVRASRTSLPVTTISWDIQHRFPPN